jgi:DNA-binding CsgD family transcriptional regulator
MDDQSAAVLHGALRRAAHSDVRVLAATRGASPLPLQDAVALELPPLTETAIRELVDDHLGRRLGPDLGRPLAAAVGGNPMFALELVRALPPDATTVDVRLSGTLADRVSARVSALPATCRSALVDLAVLGQCTWDDVADGDALAPAMSEELVRDDGRVIGFVHPLFARAVLDSATPFDLARAHARAALSATDSLERARHLAASRPEPAEAVAAELEDAASQLLERGDLLSAEQVARASVDATPTTAPAATRWRRMHTQAVALDSLGTLTDDLVDRMALLAESPDESALTRLLACRDMNERRTMLRTVVADPALSERVRLLVANELMSAELFLGDHVAGVELVAPLVPDEPPGGAEMEWADLVAGIALMSRLLGLPPDRAALDRAVDLLGERREASRFDGEGPWTTLGRIAMYDDDTETAARVLVAPAEARPDSPTAAAFHALELWCRTGQIRRARRFVDNGVGWFVDDAFSFVYTLIAAWEGDADRCEREAVQALDLAARSGDVMYPQGVATALALLELGRGNAEQAWTHSQTASATLHERRWLEPSIFPVLPIAIEAALWTGRSAAAEERLTWLEHAAAVLPSRWAAATAGRCRGLHACLAGDTEHGLETLLRSATDFDLLGLPNERARSLLLAGQIQRRDGLRSAARVSLTEALDLFTSCGIDGFAEQCRAELTRLGGRRPGSDSLTESERQVAALVAAGSSNPQAAAALRLSVKTIETHLSRVYRKLGVRGRTELAARWPELR